MSAHEDIGLGRLHIPEVDWRACAHIAAVAISFSLLSFALMTLFVYWPVTQY